VRVDDTALGRLSIRRPTPPQADDQQQQQQQQQAGGSVDGPKDGAELAARRNTSHVDQLMSLADGHIPLQLALAEAGFRPAARPTDSLARVGAGSQLSEGRAQPTTPAMQKVAQHLRLELAQARDLLAPDPADPPAVRQQRTRAAAVEAVLCHQPGGAPLRLSHQLVLLHALNAGHLDHLAGAGADRVVPEARRLLEHAEAKAAERLREVDATGELSAEGEAALLAMVAEVLPEASGRAFFTNWDDGSPETRARYSLD